MPTSDICVIIAYTRILNFDQETSSLIGNRTYHGTNVFSPYQPSSCYESDYGCICIMINGKICSVSLNILSSVVVLLPLVCNSNR